MRTSLMSVLIGVAVVGASAVGAETEAQAPNHAQEAVVTAETTNKAPATVTSTEHAPAKSDRKDVVCRRETVVGSYMSRKVCRSREQIDYERKAAEQHIDQMNRMSRSVAPPSG